MTIGLTQKGEDFKFKSWERGCLGCGYTDSICKKNQWLVDSISPTYIVLRQLINNDTAFVFDTITHYDTKKFKLYGEKWGLVKIIPTTDGDQMNTHYVYKYPIAFNRIRIPTDNISSFTFPKSQSCTGFSILVPLFTVVVVVAGIAASIAERSFIPLLIFEPVGLGLIYKMRKTIIDGKVKTYKLSEWTMTIK